jgi:chitodextrinase
VYALNTNAGRQFAVDKTVSNTPSGSTSSPAWAEGQNYPVGSLVTYSGKSIEAFVVDSLEDLRNCEAKPKLLPIAFKSASVLEFSAYFEVIHADSRH